MQIDSDRFILWDCEIEFVGIISFLEPVKHHWKLQFTTWRKRRNQTYKSKQESSNIRMWWKISENLQPRKKLLLLYYINKSKFPRQKIEVENHWLEGTLSVDGVNHSDTDYCQLCILSSVNPLCNQSLYLANAPGHVTVDSVASLSVFQSVCEYWQISHYLQPVNIWIITLKFL